MARRPDDLKQQFIELVLQGLSNGQIADELGITRDAVKGRKKRYKDEIKALREGGDRNFSEKADSQESEAETRILSSNGRHGGEKSNNDTTAPPDPPSDPPSEGEATHVNGEVVLADVIDISQHRTGADEKSARAYRQHQRVGSRARKQQEQDQVYTSPADAFPEDLSLGQIKQRLIMHIDAPTLMTPAVMGGIRTYYDIYRYEQDVKGKDSTMTPKEVKAGLEDVLEMLKQSEEIDKRLISDKLPEA